MPSFHPHLHTQGKLNAKYFKEYISGCAWGNGYGPTLSIDILYKKQNKKKTLFKKRPEKIKWPPQTNCSRARTRCRRRNALTPYIVSLTFLYIKHGTYLGLFPYIFYSGLMFWFDLLCSIFSLKKKQKKQRGTCEWNAFVEDVFIWGCYLWLKSIL